MDEKTFLKAHPGLKGKSTIIPVVDKEQSKGRWFPRFKDNKTDFFRKESIHETQIDKDKVKEATDKFLIKIDVKLDDWNEFLKELGLK